MTNWVATPETTVELNHGKGAKVVTGPVRLAFTQPGRAYVGTGSSESVVVRGRPYYVSLHFERQADGTWTEHKDNRSWNVSPRTGANSSRWDAAAAPTIRAAIVAALVDALATASSPEVDAKAAYARAAQELPGVERDIADLEVKLAELRAREAELVAAMNEYENAHPEAEPKPLTLAEKQANEEIRRARYANRWAARFLAETPEGEAHPEPTDEVMFARFRDTIVAPRTEHYPAIREQVKAQIEAQKENGS